VVPLRKRIRSPPLPLTTAMHKLFLRSNDRFLFGICVSSRKRIRSLPLPLTTALQKLPHSRGVGHLTSGICASSESVSDHRLCL
jgi:hypothetical protein